MHNLKSDLAQQKTHFLAELKKAEVASKPHEAKVWGAVMDQNLRIVRFQYFRKPQSKHRPSQHPKAFLHH